MLSAVFGSFGMLACCGELAVASGLIKAPIFGSGLGVVWQKLILDGPLNSRASIWTFFWTAARMFPGFFPFSLNKVSASLYYGKKDSPTRTASAAIQFPVPFEPDFGGLDEAGEFV